MVDNQGLSSSLQFSDPGAPTTSNASSSASTLTNSDVIAQLPLAVPMVAGILVGIVIIATIVVICFLQRRPQHHDPRRRRSSSFEAQVILQPDSRPHRHSRSQFLCDENQENATPKKKYRRYSRRSRYSTRIVELEVRNSVPPGRSRSGARESSLPSGSNRQWHSGSSSTNSTFSLNTNKIGVNRPHPSHQVIDTSQNSITLVPSTISIISSNHDEQYSPPPTTELPLQSVVAI